MAITASVAAFQGLALIASALPEQYAQIRALEGRRDRTMQECEIEVLGETHADISAEALTRSGMPFEVVNAARYHHRPDEDPMPADPEHPVLLSELVFTADRLARELGYGLFPPEQGARPAAETSAAGRQRPMAQVAGRPYDRDEVAREFEDLFGGLMDTMGV